MHGLPPTQGPVGSSSGNQKLCLYRPSRYHILSTTHGSAYWTGTWQNRFLLTRQKSGLGWMAAGQRELSGSDGSTFANPGRFMIRVGTPQQWFSVLPSTASQQTWVPHPDGCASSVVGNITDCGDSRGVWPFESEESDGFQESKSTTWQAIGIFKLFIEEHLGIDGNGLFGYDSVGLGESGPVTEHQVVAGVPTPNYWLGLLGLGANYTNFDKDERPSSLLRTLKDEEKIPSLSYGYTAGAPYSKTSYFTRPVDRIFETCVNSPKDTQRSLVA